MTKKYDDFMTELEQLCEKHGVDIDINLDRARIQRFYRINNIVGRCG